MMTCASCTDQLFDYVYGLFDEKDAADAATVSEIRTHLATCATCQAAYQKALSQQKLLGEASRVPTTITFTAPKVEPRSLRFRQQSATLTWYVSAAALIFALLGVIGSAYWVGYTATWKPQEAARLELEQLSSQPPLDFTQLTQLEKQLGEVKGLVSQQQQSVQKLEERTQKSFLASTPYQQVIAPTMVQNTSDAALLVTSSTLTGAPAPVPEMGFNLRDSKANYALPQENRSQQQTASKFNLFLPSLAYADSVNQYYSNEVVQDVSNSALGAKVTHPLHVLQTEYLAHLVTDKPLYQPGEELFFRGLALNKANFAVPRDDLEFRFTVTGPEGKNYYETTRQAQVVDGKSQEPIRDLAGRPMKGVGAASFKLPENMPSGEVTVSLTEKNNRFPEQVARVMVNPVSPPRFDKNLQFHRPSYTPGDSVQLHGTVKLANQQPLVHSRFTAQIEIDGEKYDLEGKPTQADPTGSTDATGMVRFNFKLPATVKQGRGTLAMQFGSNGGTETWSQPIRIETGQVQVECFPEGGDLIAGVPNDVYFQMRNQAGEAIDGEAEVIDSSGKTVKPFSTFHDDTEAKASRGMGKFNFIPAAKERYSVRMTKPAGKAIVATLPEAKTSGVALHVDKPVLPAGMPLSMELSNTGKPRDLVIAVYCRQVLIALDRLSMAATATQTVIVDSIKPLGGVYRVTVAEFNSQDAQAPFIPLSERLIYRQPAQTLHLKLKAEPKVGRQFDLQLDALTESNQPSPAYVTIVGVNKSLLQLAEGTTQRRLPAHFLIANEVRQPEELEFADFFLSSHPNAGYALDLLLGVQGWRRFKESSVDQLALRVQNFQPIEASLPLQMHENKELVLEQVMVRVKDSVAKSREARELAESKSRAKALEDTLQQAQRRHEQAEAERTTALRQARRSYETHSQQWQTFSLWFHLLSAGALGVMSLAGLVAMLARRSLLPTHLVCTIGALSILGLLGAFWLWQKDRSTPSVMTGAVPAVQAASPETSKMPVQPAPLQNAPAPAGGGAKADRQPKEALKGDESFNYSMGKKSNTPPAKTDDAASKTAELQRPADKSMAPPTLARSTNDSLKMKGNSSTFGQQGYPNRRSLNNNEAGDNNLKLLENQRSTQLTDNRMKLERYRETEKNDNKDALLRDKEGLWLEKKNEVTQDSAKPMAPGATRSAPGKADRGTPGKPLGGIGGTGGMGGGGLGGGQPPPASRGGKAIESDPGKLPPAKVTTGAMDSAKTAEGAAPRYFFNRVYSWKEQARPAALTTSAAWSRTIYWNPFAVVPATGKLTIPLELPASDGSYQFEVFGHDGQGRLGATSLEVKAPQPPPKPTPVGLSLRLSRTEAKVGDVVQLDCQVENQTSRRQPQIIVKLQLPEGLRLPENLRQLRQAVRSTTAGDYVEPTRWFVQDRELTLIWAELPTEKKVTLTIDLLCNKAGDYQASESRAYLQNQERDASISPGLRINIRQ